MLEWKHPQYWQRLSPTTATWHLDNSTVSAWVTLCGRRYDSKAPQEVYEEPQGQPICKHCQKEMVKLMLRLGLPKRGVQR